MATRPRQTEYDAIVDGRHVVHMARLHFAAIAAADARRKHKLLPEERLAAFEATIEGFEWVVAERGATLTRQIRAGMIKAQRRAELFSLLAEIRDVIKLGRPGDRSLGRAFGVGLRLDKRSTSRLLTAGQVVLSSWERPEFGPVAVDLGITAESIARLRALVEGLVALQTEHGTMRAVGRGQSLNKKLDLRKLRRETTYLRNVARIVFRHAPEVLIEFASPVRRVTVKPRGARAGRRGGEGGTGEGAEGGASGSGPGV
ncbi:MAG TPA: hypothetical protein VH877_15630 [Polyangia bacterium]|jgi:hypothetical protein|nr:hypothetical protein [Polyangia bacterium]